MNVEQMSVADLLREGKQAMSLAVGSVGPDTRARWLAAMDEIDLRLAVGDIEEDDLEGRVQAVAKQRDDAIAERDRAHQQISNNTTNLQFVQDAFDKNHPALKGAWGCDRSRGAMLLWAWAQTVLPTESLGSTGASCSVCQGTGVFDLTCSPCKACGKGER